MKTMRSSYRHAGLRVILAGFALLAAAAASAENRVVNLEIKGGIGVATAEYVIKGIEYGNEQNADLIVLNTDTPGGLVSATRDIIQAILGSDVPVATYVTPAGARADSAGTYILLASHIAAMAPTTHIGAATPVSMTGDDLTPPPEDIEPNIPGYDDPEASEDAAPDEDPAAPAGSAMERKVLNDAISYIRTLAERHGRNADWAERAVTEAATLTADEALEQNVIEYIAVNQDELFAAVNGNTVETNAGEVTIATANPTVEEFEPDWRLKLLMVLSQPEILLLLGLVGVYGLILEGWNPGALVPGTLGAICLLLALYGSQTIPINYAGVALILLGIGLMVAEAFAPSFGVLGLGGIAAFVFGAILTFDSAIPGFGISIAFVLGLAIAAALFIVWVVGYLLKLRNRGAVSGSESIVGGIGVAMQDFTEEGKIWLEGEAWQAHSTVPIGKDQEVIVTAMDGLVLEVRPAPADHSAAAEPAA
ncbi:MAG: nodulation protein NfeD [Pseudomonadota bacterium]